MLNIKLTFLFLLLTTFMFAPATDALTFYGDAVYTSKKDWQGPDLLTYDTTYDTNFSPVHFSFSATAYDTNSFSEFSRVSMVMTARTTFTGGDLSNSPFSENLKQNSLSNGNINKKLELQNQVEVMQLYSPTGIKYSYNRSGTHYVNIGNIKDNADGSKTTWYYKYWYSLPNISNLTSSSAIHQPVFLDFESLLDYAINNNINLNLGEFSYSHSSLVNDDGTIRYFDYHGSHYDGYINLTSIDKSQPVPEPSTIILLGLSLVGVTVMSKRAKKV